MARGAGRDKKGGGGWGQRTPTEKGQMSHISNTGQGLGVGQIIGSMALTQTTSKHRHYQP